MTTVNEETNRIDHPSTASTEPSETHAPQQSATSTQNPSSERPNEGPTRKEKETMEDFATALETFEAETEALEHDNRIHKGTVISLTPNHVMVDIGSKTEGVVRIDEVKDHEGNVTVKPGDEIDVMISHGEREEGYLVLSHERAKRLKVWDDIEKAYNDKTDMKGRVVERVKGGLSVDIGGARAFLPGSQVDLKSVRNLDGMKGQEIEVRVIKLNKKRGNIVVSRKAIIEEETAEKRTQTLEHLAEGAVLTGIVKNLTDYGAFVDLGGIHGLLHLNDK